MKELTTARAGGLAALQNFKSGLVAARTSIAKGVNSGEPLLRMNKVGDWVYGADSTPPEEDSLWMVNIESLQHGYVCWVEGKVAGEVMVPIGQPLPELHSLPVYSKPWQLQEGAQLRCMSGEDEGLQVQWKNNSKGFHDAFATLLDAIISRIEAGEAALYPVCLLDVESYKHKEYGTVYKPVLKIVDWKSNQETPETEPEEEETPIRRRRRTA